LDEQDERQGLAGRFRRQDRLIVAGDAHREVRRGKAGNRLAIATRDNDVHSAVLRRAKIG
jgi:hypothetical protein